MEKNTREYNYVPLLTIAGSDSGGGAGIQADLKTFSALGCFGMSVVTSITAQNTLGVRSIHGVPAAFVKDQLEAVLEDIFPKAIKIGMLGSPEIVLAVTETMKRFPEIPIIVDPVMVASSGDRLIKEETVESLKKELFPIAHLITPNLDESTVLLESPIETKEDMLLAGSKLLKWGSKAVLVKGGHLKGSWVFDVLCQQGGGTEVFEGRFVQTTNTHGTGCTLSSAIAANLALGKSLFESIRVSKEYVSKALNSGKNVRFGSGKGPLNHFFDPIPLLKTDF